ncbi:SGNH/GDSL hydrolase family protein [Pontibacter sp. HJ8]
MTAFRHTGLAYVQEVSYRVKSLDVNENSSEYSAVATATTHASTYTYQIMPLGDSNTHGTRSNDTRPDGDRIAYRKELHRLLTLQAVKFNFVGSEVAGQNQFEDPENGGFPGIRDEDLADILDKGWHYWYCTTGCPESAKRIYANGPYLNDYHPDIILLHIGTNWVDPSGVGDVTRILNLIDKYENEHGREVTVVLARIIQRVENSVNGKEKAFTTTYNDQVEAMARERMGQGDRIVLVDMENGAGINYRYASEGGDMNDNLHPSQSGYNKMASVWLNGLSELLEINPLPVELVSFSASGSEQGVLLRWETASEQDNSHFEIERMEAGGAFRKIGNLKGMGTTSVSQSYRFTDLAAPAGILYYRLRQVDVDGTFSHSKVVAVQRILSGTNAVYPNPSAGETMLVHMSGLAEGPAEVTVLNTMGEEVYVHPASVNSVGQLRETLAFPVPLTAGVYIVQVRAAGKVSRQKVLVQ